MTKEEQFVNELIGYIFAYPDDDYMTMECLCRKLVKHGLLDKADGYYQTHDIRTNTHECVKDTHDKTEPRKEQNICGKCRYLYRDFKYGLSCYRLMDNEPCKYEERKTEPTISKMEQVEGEPTWEQVKEYCNKRCLDIVDSALRKQWYKDEPQTDRSMAVGKRSDATADKYNLYGKTTTDEPQTEYKKWETPPKFEHKEIITTCVSVPACLLEIEDEPQTDCAWR